MTIDDNYIKQCQEDRKSLTKAAHSLLFIRTSGSNSINVGEIAVNAKKKNGRNK